MGTPMPINFANVFMGRFEGQMLQDYERIYDKNQRLGNITITNGAAWSIEF